MRTLLYTAAAIIALSALVPLFVWGNTGNWRHALHAWKQYAITMAVLCLPGILAAGIVILSERI